jgi:hypothetical protein
VGEEVEGKWRSAGEAKSAATHAIAAAACAREGEDFELCFRPLPSELGRRAPSLSSLSVANR